MKLIFLGPPGAGKGTMAKRLAAARGIVHISTGDLFREAIANKTELGLEVKAIIEKGGLVPDSLTVRLATGRLAAPDCGKGFILDGFPRTSAQAEALEKFTAVDAAVNFELSEAEVVRRLSGRRLCPSCGATFHVDFMPPKTPDVCDVCGKALVIRKDDQIEAIRNRLAVYTRETEPLISFYGERGLLKNVNAAPAPDEVFAAVRKIL
ncbi:MAG: adenylate kinase [Spirochaetales bacterium]|jgi:adenylate kinase|nr:adenylate kinase [Spirochaetales bacterium]